VLHSVCRTFLNSAEDQLGVFAQYYGLPQLSLRDVVWHETEAGAPGFSLDDIMLPNGGNIHPNERGHGCGGQGSGCMALQSLTMALVNMPNENLLARENVRMAAWSHTYVLPAFWIVMNTFVRARLNTSYFNMLLRQDDGGPDYGAAAEDGRGDGDAAPLWRC